MSPNVTKMPPLDRLKGQLLSSNIQQENFPLYQVINSLIEALRQTIDVTEKRVADVTDAVDTISPTQTIINQIISPYDGEDGLDGQPGPIGPVGPVGPMGPSGTGIGSIGSFLGFAFEQEQQDEIIPLIPAHIQSDWFATYGPTAILNRPFGQSFNSSAGAVNNLAFDGKSSIIATGGITDLSGIVRGVAGQLLTLTNSHATVHMNLLHNSGSSTFGNRFINPNAGTIILRAGQTAIFQYSETLNSWVLINIDSVGTTTQVIFNDGGILTGDSGMLFDKTGNVLHVAGGYNERGRSVALGEWVNVSHVGTDFNTSGAGTWTVDIGDLQYFRYMIVGKTMWIAVMIATSTVSGMAPGDALRIKVPGGVSVAAFTVQTTLSYLDGSGVFDGGGQVQGVAGNIYLYLNRRDVNSTWVSVVNGLYVRFVAAVDIL